MKKNRIYLVFVLVSMVFVFTACKKEVTAKSCTELENEWSDAFTAYLTTQSEATCNDYYNTLHDYIDGCGTLTAAQRADFEDGLSQIDCSIY